LSVWDQTVREGQQSIVFAVCSRATCTEERQRLERLSRSRQKSFLKEKKKQRQELEKCIAENDELVARVEASDARSLKAVAGLEETRQKQKESTAKLVRFANKLRLISIVYSLLHSFVNNHY
jgi:(p)ppGpp synthase/HD superfamily hydrolase